MALTSTDWMGSLGPYGTNLDKVDCSDVLAAVLLKDTATLGQIKMGESANNTQVYWIEDSLNSCILEGSLSVGASCDNGYMYSRKHSTTATIKRLVPDGYTLIRHEKYPYHLFRASAGLSTTLTIMPYGSVTVSGSAMDSTYNGVSDRWFILGRPKADEADASDDISQERLRRYNITQVFERGLAIAQTREGIDMYAVPDEIKHQIKMRTYEVKRELNNAVINSYILASATPADSGVRTMAGLIQLIRDPGLSGTHTDINVTNAAGTALTMARINSLCSAIYSNGGFDDQANCCIIVGPYQARVIALLEEQRIRKTSKELIVGSYANKVMTDLGFEVPVVLDRWMPNDMLIILDKSRAKLRPLSGDAWHLEKMAKTGRTQKYQLSGQYTLELRNANEAHGLIYRLSFS